MKVRKALVISFFISLVYVGLGTISILGSYPKGPFYLDWSPFGILFTLPVSVIGFGIYMVERGNYTLILLIQFCVFLLFWKFVYDLVLRNR